MISKDQRRIEVEDLRGFDAVVHLAELSNDPIGENDPGLTMAINHEGSVALARKAREAGVARFIQASSCSTYGAGGDEMRTETSPLAPQTAYARVQDPGRGRRAGADGRALHPGLHAQRHRLRRQPAAAVRPGAQQPLRLRPYHRRDPHDLATARPGGRSPISRTSARRCSARSTAPREAVAGEAFNVGADGENYRIREIAEIVAATFPGCALTVGDSGGDTRSYRVSFAKIRAHMPEFQTRWTAERGARQLKAVFERIGLTRGDLRGRALHPAEGAQAPARHRPARRDAVLEGARADRLSAGRRPCACGFVQDARGAKP